MGLAERKRRATREDVESRSSRKPGMAGAFETVLRQLREVAYGGMLIPFYVFGCSCIGAALVPGIALFHWMTTHLRFGEPVANLFVAGFAIGLGYFCYGFSLIVVLPLANFLLRARLRPWRGPYYSLESISWYIHNGATYLMRYTFLEFITPSPFNLIFYRLMGMKIGAGSIINTSFISDPSLIEIGRRVTLGGSVTLVAHYGQGGYLVLAPVSIGDGATIGLKSTIMGGVRIGRKAKILPNSVVLPNTVVPDGETWGGVPARKFSIFKAA